MPRQDTPGPGPTRGRAGKLLGYPEIPKTKQISNSEAQPALATKKTAETQKQEIQAIQFAYQEGFHMLKPQKTAWMQQEAAFAVTLTSTPVSDGSKMIFDLKVTVTLPAAYPKTAPKITLELDKRLHISYEEEMTQMVSKLIAKMLHGDDPEPSIVFDALQHLQQDLDKLAANKAADAKVPSLEAQRAKDQADNENKKAQEEAHKAEEERQRQISESAKSKLAARNARREAARTADPTTSDTRPEEIINPQDRPDQNFILAFGKTLKVEDINGVERKVERIKGHQFFARGPVSDCYKVVPDMAVLPARCLIVKRSRIKASAQSTGEGRTDQVTIDTLETDLKTAVNAGQGSDRVARILDFRIEPATGETGMWYVEVLMEHAPLGSLENFLASAQALTTNRATELGLEILQGLDYLHGNGVMHRDLHASNILLFQNANGRVSTKIADIHYQDSVHCLMGLPSWHRFDSKANRAWIPNELIDPRSGSYSEKTDIWFYGVILLQMLFGLHFMDRFSSIYDLVDKGSDVSQSLRDLCAKVFQHKPKKRPRASELKGFSYFTTGENDSVENSDRPNPRNRRNSSMSTAHRNISHIMWPDRFEEEFIVLGHLGKGGFGEVLHARKRLDSQEYAVKKIKESDDMPFDEMVREVQSLSSLQSMYIVRYYSAWTQKTLHASGVGRFAAETESDYSKSFAAGKSKALTGVSAMSKSLDFVANRSRLSRHMSFSSEDEESEDEDYEVDEDDEGSEADGEDDGDEDGEDEDDDEDDDDDDDDNGDVVFGEDSENQSPNTTPQQRAPKFQSVVFGNDDPGNSVSNVDPNENAIASDDDENDEDDTDLERRGTYRTLYIQMELCTGGNLREAIRKEGLQDNPKEITRILRQILEGLKYVHSKGQIHRDLKPENIFFDDKSPEKRTVRIGDFGLAAMGIRERLAGANSEDPKMTGGVGTAYYVAPEVKNGEHYGAKADMYSLGIILFELCYHHMPSAFERSTVLDKLRQKNPELPEDFNGSKTGGLDKIILKLLTHDQSQRPTAEEVLASGDLPDSVGMDVIHGAMTYLTDPNSVFHREFVEALFSRPQDSDAATERSIHWDVASNSNPPHPCHSVMRCIVKDELTRLFRHHGALDVSRPTIFPLTTENDAEDGLVRVLGPDGTILQLRHEMTIPLARSVATVAPKIMKYDAFGGQIKFYIVDDVYRQAGKDGAEVASYGEAAFDIISDSQDLTLKEAEAMKVLEEIAATFPCLDPENMCFNVNHSDILNLVFDHCCVQVEYRDVVISLIAQLSVGDTTWVEMERSLQDRGLAKTSVIKLQDFIFREPLELAISRMEDLFKDELALLKRLAKPVAHIKEVLKYLHIMGGQCRVLMAPLGCAKEKICRGGFTFSFQVVGTRKLLAAGGRYDRLIGKFASHDNTDPTLSHAVGFGLSWDELTQLMHEFYRDSFKGKKAKPTDAEFSGIWKAKRCDVLVYTHDPHVRRKEALSLLNYLWSSGISAELARDASNDEISHVYKEDSHYWLATIKSDGTVKIKTIGHNAVKNGLMNSPTKKRTAAGDCTVSSIDDVVPKLKALIRERESAGHGTGSGHVVAARKHDHAITQSGQSHITMVVSQNHGQKGKTPKTLNDRVVSNVQSASTNMMQQMLNNVQTFAIDLPNDSDLEVIQNTPLCREPEWRDVTQRSSNGEVRSRLGNLWGELLEYKATMGRRGRPRHVILYNQRTGKTFLFDAGL